MNSAPHYPEHHSTWLAAMGMDVVWRARQPEPAVVGPTAAMPVAAPTSTSETIPLRQRRLAIYAEQSLTAPEQTFVAQVLGSLGRSFANVPVHSDTTTPEPTDSLQLCFGAAAVHQDHALRIDAPALTALMTSASAKRTLWQQLRRWL